jgi:hypothetical protein
MNNSNYSSWNMNGEDFQDARQNQTMNNDAKYNGRIFFKENFKEENFKENEFTPGYELYEGSNQPQKCFQDSVSTIQEMTPLSQAYFNKQNIDKIQQQIINQVRIRSNNKYNIGRQSDLQLQIIMRSMYLSYSKNNNNNIQKQIDDLNSMVIDDCIKKIIPEIKQYLHYRNDISTPRYIPPHSVNPSDNNKQLGNPLFPS